jgi:hypothetical protein
MLIRSKYFVEKFFQPSQNEPFRQILVTLSPQLANSIKKTYQTNEIHLDVCKEKETAVEEHIYSFRELIKYLDRCTGGSVLKLESSKYKVNMEVDVVARFSDELPFELSFHEFSKNVYRHLNQQLQRRFSESFVFTQFISVIKGSQGALGSGSGALSEEEYVALSNQRSGSILSEDDRRLIYDAWKKYEKIKVKAQLSDISDITFRLYTELQREIATREDLYMDCVYIDEAR